MTCTPRPSTALALALDRTKVHAEDDAWFIHPPLDRIGSHISTVHADAAGAVER